MTYKEAARFIHPDTCVQTVEEAKYYGGLRGEEVALEKMNEACLLACKALKFMDFYESDYFGFREATR